MKRLRYIFLALCLVSGLYNLGAQRSALRINLLGLATANLNLEASRMLGAKWSAHLSLQAKPWAYPLPMPVGALRYIENLDNHEQNLLEFGTIKHTENYTVQPSLRYWTKGAYNRGLFFGLHAIGTLFEYGGDKFDTRYRKGWGIGAGLSFGYSHELSQRLNLELELGLGGLYRNYKLVSDETDKAYYGTYKDLIPTVSRLGVSLVYLL